MRRLIYNVITELNCNSEKTIHATGLHVGLQIKKYENGLHCNHTTCDDNDANGWYKADDKR